ncbi:von Willebrand factor D and EGF domain-containing protein-like [Mercenaria mercenaria]|uniref:von Willebrand factor D and EGF domain-containing protein-like n=1 Tax=Mercenaria mercenaria TaxID=6596 RepID=UPI00234F9C5C|nr:von Willebrand factor D and EGF domain-containing protein-like [Mercenaria mercenaria]
MSKAGEFTMYESTARPFQIQIRTQPYVHNNRTYNVICAAAVQESNDVIVVDMCHVSHSTTPLKVIFPNGKLSAGTIVSRSLSYMSPVVNITFSSGAFVTVKAYETFLVIFAHSAKEDFNATRGLCGIFDGNIDNDLTRPNLHVDLFPPNFQDPFADSWRIPQWLSIFHKFGIRKRNTKGKYENIVPDH